MQIVQHNANNSLSQHTQFHGLAMTEVFRTSVCDLVLPKKDTDQNHNLARQQQNQLSAANSATLLKEIEQFHKSKSLKLNLVLEVDDSLSQDTSTEPSPNTTLDVVVREEINAQNIKSSQWMWSCAICFDNLEQKNSTCTICQFCVPCLCQYVEVQIEEKSAHMTSRRTIRCPCLRAECEIDTQAVETILSALSEEKRDILSAKFHKFALDLEIQRDPARVFCPNRDCSSVVTLPVKTSNVGPLRLYSHQAQCQDCKHTFCTQCHNTHSRFTSCDSVVESQLRSWRRNTPQGCKKCPGCRVYIEKHDGCSHMTCRACGTGFCWQCLGPIHDDNAHCMLLALAASEVWGGSTATRVMTKSLAVPLGLVVGGVAIGAAAVAASLAVAAAGVLLCASPAISGYKYHQRAKHRRDNRELNARIQQTEIFHRGIVVVLPPKYVYNLSAKVDLLLAQSTGVLVGAEVVESAAVVRFRVAYTDKYVVYFTTTPSAVPGFEEDDYPFHLLPAAASAANTASATILSDDGDDDDDDDADESIDHFEHNTSKNHVDDDKISYFNADGVVAVGTRAIVTHRRGYIQLSCGFVDQLARKQSASSLPMPGEDEAEFGSLVGALDGLYRQASERIV